MPRSRIEAVNYRELWDAFLYDDEPEQAPAPSPAPAEAINDPAAEDPARQQIESYHAKWRARHAKKQGRE